MLEGIPITKAREDLTRLPEILTETPGALAVTRRGKAVLAIMSWELYESIMETLEIMGDEDLMATLRQSIKEGAVGETIPWETVKAGLDA